MKIYGVAIPPPLLLLNPFGVGRGRGEIWSSMNDAFLFLMKLKKWSLYIS